MYIFLFNFFPKFILLRIHFVTRKYSLLFRLYLLKNYLSAVLSMQPSSGILVPHIKSLMHGQNIWEQLETILCVCENTYMHALPHVLGRQKTSDLLVLDLQKVAATMGMLGMLGLLGAFHHSAISWASCVIS